MALFKLTVTKRILYRDVWEEWGNSYVFSGTQPADQAAWDAWAARLLAIERPMLTSIVQWVDWYGYNDGHWQTKPTHIDAAGTFAASTAGTLSASGTLNTPADAAFWVRWDTGQYTSRGKKIYLRKYFHGALYAGSAYDTVAPTQKAAANTYAALMYSGSGLIGTARLARDTGTLAIAHNVADYITTRTLKRRGKRNPTP